MPSSMRPTRNLPAAAASTAPFTEPADRPSWPNAAPSAAAQRAQGRAHHCWGPSGEVRHPCGWADLARRRAWRTRSCWPPPTRRAWRSPRQPAREPLRFPPSAPALTATRKQAPRTSPLRPSPSCATASSNFDEIRFVLFSDADLQVYQQALAPTRTARIRRQLARHIPRDHAAVAGFALCPVTPPPCDARSAAGPPSAAARASAGHR